MRKNKYKRIYLNS